MITYVHTAVCVCVCRCVHVLCRAYTYMHMRMLSTPAYVLLGVHICVRMVTHTYVSARMGQHMLLTRVCIGCCCCVYTRVYASTFSILHVEQS